MRRLRVLVLMHSEFVPPDSMSGYTAQEKHEWKTEYDVVSTLRAAGHEVHPLGVEDELKPVRDGIEGFKPHVAFTLVEKYHGEIIYDQNLASYLELMQVPYTGCNPRGLLLARGKDLSKTLAHYRRIPVPAFAVFPMSELFVGTSRHPRSDCPVRATAASRSSSQLRRAESSCGRQTIPTPYLPGSGRTTPDFFISSERNTCGT